MRTPVPWKGALPVRRSLRFYVHFSFGSAKSDPRAPRMGLRLSMYSSAWPRLTLGFENHPAAAGRGRDPSPTWVAEPFLGEMERI